MITILFRDFHVELPFPPVPIQLITAIKIGLQRIVHTHGTQQFEGLQVRLNGEHVLPSASQTLLKDGSTISIIPVTLGERNKDTVFVLDL